MRMVGTANAHDLVTVSTDGRMCSWSTDNLQAPIEVNELMCNKTKKPISALSMAFMHNSINNFVLGTEEGELYIGDRHAASGDSSRSITGPRILAHQMSVNSLDMHRAMGPIDFSPLCLTGSMDFGIKLWNIKIISFNLHTANTMGNIFGRSRLSNQQLDDIIAKTLQDESDAVHIFDVHECLYNSRPSEWDIRFYPIFCVYEC